MTFAIQNPISAVIMTFVFGVTAFAVVAPLQLRVMNAAGHAPDVASAANISAFTLGSAIGISLGGAAIDGGLGLASVNWIGGLITTAGLVIAVITWARLDRRTATMAHEHGHADDRGHQHETAIAAHDHGDTAAQLEQVAATHGHEANHHHA